MKAYTDINQSKKLAEILPIESADMGYIPSEEDDDGNTLYTAEFKSEFIFDDDCCISCWSLAALLEVISYPTLSQEYDGKWSCMEFPGDEEVEGCENPIDACYEIILSLNEQKLL